MEHTAYPVFGENDTSANGRAMINQERYSYEKPTFFFDVPEEEAGFTNRTSL